MKMKGCSSVPINKAAYLNANVSCSPMFQGTILCSSLGERGFIHFFYLYDLSFKEKIFIN